MAQSVCEKVHPIVFILEIVHVIKILLENMKWNMTFEVTEEFVFICFYVLKWYILSWLIEFVFTCFNSLKWSILS